MAAARFLDTYNVIEFSIELDGARRVCWISQEALEDRFGANRETAVPLLMQNMQTIAPVAERVARATAPGETVLVKSEHF